MRQDIFVKPVSEYSQPHGVLFRGGAEGKIRQALIEENLLDAVRYIDNLLAQPG